jgi:hypothetical protein
MLMITNTALNKDQNSVWFYLYLVAGSNEKTPFKKYNLEILNVNHTL